MIEQWQVWQANLDHGVQPVVVISSATHLRSLTGRAVIVCPLSDTDYQLRNRPQVTDPAGVASWVITDQIHTITSLRFKQQEPEWTLSEEEIDHVRRALRHMLDF